MGRPFLLVIVSFIQHQPLKQLRAPLKSPLTKFITTLSYLHTMQVHWEELRFDSFGLVKEEGAPLAGLFF